MTHLLGRFEWMDVEEVWPHGVTLPDGPRDVDDVLLIAADEEDLHLILKDGLDVEQVLGLSMRPFIPTKYDHNSVRSYNGKSVEKKLPSVNSNDRLHSPPASPSMNRSTASSSSNKNAQRVSYIETYGSQILQRHKTTIRTTPIIVQTELGMDIDAFVGKGKIKPHATFQSAPCLDSLANLSAEDIATDNPSSINGSLPRSNSADGFAPNDTVRVACGAKKAARFDDTSSRGVKRAGIKRSQSSPTKSDQWNEAQSKTRQVIRSRTNLDIEVR